ncbi:hypothetical protein VTL71DRAFT_2883 [Oculimacula yallundae]|uniref:Rhodopsin domain-containing protein n=1 Tax=Oculimacula yallundae TaxID=86028 RepID=A0ABR4C5J1_9HELO
MGEVSLLAESWIWYAFACVIIITRYTSRYLQLGSIKAFQAEDYVMVLVFVFYTVLTSTMNIVAHLDTNLMLPEDIPMLTPESIASRIRGSKYVLVVEQSMIMTQWGCKICLLLLYNKLTMGLKQHLAVKIVAGYTVGAWVLMEILYFGVWCRPFSGYWSVPVQDVQCSTALHHLITNAVFNITSDLMMLCIPLPLLIASQIPKASKLILCVLFSLGIFVILCACINKFYSFTDPFSPMWTFWYIREASTAVYVANIPMCWPLMRRIFKLRAFNGISSGGKGNGYSGSKARSAPIATSYTGVGSSKIGMGSKIQGSVLGSRIDRSERGGNWWEGKDGATNGTKLGRSESEEYIVGNAAGAGRGAMPLEIWESRDVTVDRGSTMDQTGVVTSITTPGLVKGKVSKKMLGHSNNDRGMRTGMYDGSNKEFETRTTVTAIGNGPVGRKSESGSSRSGRSGRNSR